MPKKKPAKGKKGKGSKAKTEGKHEARADTRESDLEKAKAAAALWELRLDVTEESRVQYREAARRLARANNDLSSQQYRAEKDMVDIISLLRIKDTEREEKVGAYTLRINELEERFKKRSDDFDMIQVELKKIKEFRKRKAQMEQELSSIRESMHLADRNHMENLGRVETKFFTEKARLEREAEQRLAQLAESAHDEAIVKLDDASRSVFKENVRLNEALNYHIKEVEDLKNLAASLAEGNASMSTDKATDALIIKKNTAQMKAYREEVSDLKVKLGSLERALELLAGEFEREKREIREKALVSGQAGREDLGRLQRQLSAREREIARIKCLAGSVEQAAKAYQVRMNEARAGKQQYPLVRTFHKNPHSTNCVYSDMEEAQKWAHVQSNQVDIADLTWEQKEKVLRLLFARMNGQKTRKASQTMSLPASIEKSQMDSAAGTTEAVSHTTFMTQMHPSNPDSLPDIHMT
ncbi:hypothetical protein CRUP_033165 [Coryphaenoides rupestris]|nr:hypothetical protein CRUP_033165 [Coryphaenoides rupestris]